MAFLLSSSSAVRFTELSVDCDFGNYVDGPNRSACLLGWSEHPNLPSPAGGGEDGGRGFQIMGGSSWSIGFVKYTHDVAIAKTINAL